LPALRRHIQANESDKVGVDRVLWKTRHMRKKSIGLVLLWGALIFTACSAPPQLEPRSAANPAGIDLSGAWRIRARGGEPLARKSEQPQTIKMPERDSTRTNQQAQRRPQRSDGGDVWIFLETGKVLKVTQTSEGLFVSFDRAIVEEFIFGENRTVSVGPIEAHRVSGWVGSELVVQTMDKDGAVLTETWALAEDGSVLVRKIEVKKGDTQLFSARQVFDQA